MTRVVGTTPVVTTCTAGDGPASDEHVGGRLRSDVGKREHHARCAVAEGCDGLDNELAISGQRDGGRRSAWASARTFSSIVANRERCSGTGRRRRAAHGAQRERAVEIDMNHVAVAAHLMSRRHGSAECARAPRERRPRPLLLRPPRPTRGLLLPAVRFARRSHPLAQINEERQRIWTAGHVSHRIGCLDADGCNAAARRSTTCLSAAVPSPRFSGKRRAKRIERRQAGSP